MTALTLLIAVLSGAVGGNLAGETFKELNLGLIGNTFAGIIGGVLGGRAIQQLVGAISEGVIELQNSLAILAGAAISGAAVMIIVGWINNAKMRR